MPASAEKAKPAQARIATRDRILTAAHALFYRDGLRTVTLDAIGAEAGVTKKTIYYHFRNKDALIEAYLASRDQPTLEYYKVCFHWAEGDLATKIEAIFQRSARFAEDPRWRGCMFQRAAAELADTPEHAALGHGAAHKTRLETWLTDAIAETRPRDAVVLARQISVLIDGLNAAMLLRRDPTYATVAGRAAAALVRGAAR